MENRADSGFLVLADISGFTTFISETELEHGPPIIADLMEAVMKELTSVMTIQEVEGDAIFAYALDRDVGNPATLLDKLERTFVAFRSRQRDMKLNTTCTCQACRGIPSLNLKIIGHHGHFLRQAIGSHRQLSGKDVILAHRLLKNQVPGPAYLLLTDPFIRQTGIEPGEVGMARHSESYEHLGEVPCYFCDLEPVWQEAAQARVIKAETADAIMLTESVLPCPPAVAWDWLINPARRVRYEHEAGVVGLTEQRKPGGRTGAGMTQHCDHGQFKQGLTYVDWRPYEYFTVDIENPLGPMRYTAEFMPDPGGTRVRRTMSPVPRPPWWRLLMLRRILKSGQKAYDRADALLREILRQERAELKPEAEA